MKHRWPPGGGGRTSRHPHPRQTHYNVCAPQQKHLPPQKHLTPHHEPSETFSPIASLFKKTFFQGNFNKPSTISRSPHNSVNTHIKPRSKVMGQTVSGRPARGVLVKSRVVVMGTADKQPTVLSNIPPLVRPSGRHDTFCSLHMKRWPGTLPQWP